MILRPYEPGDWPGVWTVLEPVFRAGETFPHDPAIDSAAARRAWVEAVDATVVANAGYVVAEAARGRRVGHALCRHSQAEARRRGFTAMQFNLVVSTNTAGVAAWSRNGFRTIGRLPGAFRHPQLGEVDALVMFKVLD